MKKIDNLKWKLRFIELAEHIATWSKDPSTRCGAILVTSDAKVVSMGYNGLPSGFDDSKIVDREYKIPRVIHAEMNCIANRNMSINEDCYMFVTHPVCPDCAKLIIAHPFIKGVSWKRNNEFSKRWNIAESIQLLEEASKDIFII